MSTAELNEKKRDLIAWINRLSDEPMIEFLEALKSSETNTDWWDDLADSKKQVLKNGLDDIEKGDVLSATQFWNMLKNV